MFEDFGGDDRRRKSKGEKPANIIDRLESNFGLDAEDDAYRARALQRRDKTPILSNLTTRLRDKELSPSEEADLICAAQAGDKRAVDKLVRAHRERRHDLAGLKIPVSAWITWLALPCSGRSDSRRSSTRARAHPRVTHPLCGESELIGRLTLGGRLLFLQLFTIVDDDGRARAVPRMLVGRLYPYDDDVGIDDIEQWLAELEAQEHIRGYDVNGSQYLEIINWAKHQKIDHKTASKLPPSTEGTPISRKTREDFAKNSRMARDGLAPDLELNRSGMESKGSELSSSRCSDDAPVPEKADDRFDQFWKVYPHKVGKIDARKAFAKAIKVVTFDQLMVGLDTYVHKTDDRPWCNPATWLNEGRWDDQPAPPPQASDATVEGLRRAYERRFGDNVAEAA